MRRFAMMVLVTLATACGGELPTDPGDGGTCQPDPSEARAIVNVVVRSEADDLDRAKPNPRMRADDLWALDWDAENGQSGALSPTPEADTEAALSGEAFDVLRGQRVTVQVRPGPALSETDTLPATRTITLDRSCELVIVVSDEWDKDGETLRFTLSHFWR